MEETTLLFFAVVTRGLCIIAAVAGVVFLAFHDKAGWGWLIFVAVILSSYSVTTPSKERAKAAHKPPASTNTSIKQGS